MSENIARRIKENASPVRRRDGLDLYRILKDCEANVVPVPEAVEAEVGRVLMNLLTHKSDRVKSAGLKLYYQAKRMQLDAAIAQFNAKENPNAAKQESFIVIQGAVDMDRITGIED